MDRCILHIIYSHIFTLTITKDIFQYLIASTTTIIYLTIKLRLYKLCIGAIYTGYIKEPGCPFKGRARRIVRRASLYLISISPSLGFLSVCPSCHIMLICTGRWCTCALAAATQCKGPLNVFRMKRALYKYSECVYY